MQSEIVLAGAVRSPIGSFSGTLAEMPAGRLGAEVIKATIDKTGVPANQINEVLFGNVVGAGLGQNVARQATIGAGLPNDVGATTINKVCGSGLKTVMLAAQSIQCQDAEIIVAGGTENMSAAPYLLTKARNGYRLGNGELIDAVVHDGLWDVYHQTHMGCFGDRCAEKYQLSRDEQDDFAVESYKRALAFQENPTDEIISVEAPAGRKKTITVNQDEEPQRFNEEKLRNLRPAFEKEGSVTAGNASSINDGSAAVMVMSKDAAQTHNVPIQAKILAYTTHSQEPEWFTIAPVSAIKKLLEQLKLTVSDVDLFEINEAFSVVPMAAMKDLNIPRDKVNIHGGAVALGHPIGASGTRTLVTLIHALERHNAQIGIVSLCIGGGEAVAMAVERC